ncbi:uncharacterized protein CC84DRAFT_1161719 [Paraphaeosphaeria sporulosa]|uniref:Uncharacterized protein n=1 Tax=Paraphaeosphaeria sporulosa TaxID=1460663 RepID=A0A177CUH8_9PLEO|nr:uncharacterized protein CC84DRAFT_1161719 [Paraphaeosphaeria sporulosa]OAG10896.1 hypothetical protein CC84DRAFT_1161719 [Paraphaeosphaeria sporulosa]
MAQRARDEIDFILAQAAATQGEGPPRPDKAAAQADINTWQRWHRVRGTFISMFGHDVFAKHEDATGNPSDVPPGQPKGFARQLTRGQYMTLEKN